jgi:hypothetical protein
MTCMESPVTFQDVLDFLARWINDGGWTVTHRLRRFQEDYGVELGAEVVYADLSFRRVKLVFAKGTVFEHTDIDLRLPDFRHRGLSVRVPHPHTRQGPGGVPEVVNEWLDGLVVAPDASTWNSQIGQLNRLVSRLNQQRWEESERQRLERIAGQIKQAHPVLGDVRIADQGKLVEMDLPDGTALKLRLVEEGGDAYEPGVFHLAIDNLTL